MANSRPPQASRSSAFITEAGNVDPERKMWWPARWIAQMVQYMVAILMLTIAEGLKAIVSGKKSKSRGRRKGRAREL